MERIALLSTFGPLHLFCYVAYLSTNILGINGLKRTYLPTWELVGYHILSCCSAKVLTCVRSPCF